VEITSPTDGAKVYLYEGTTPVEIPHLDRGVSQELLVTQTGFWPQPALATPSAWQGDRAELAIALSPRSARPPAPPAIPPPEHASDRQGTLRVATTPAGSEVWLLIGITPNVHIEGLRADAEQRLLVAAPHHLPRPLVAHVGDWKEEGDHATFRSEVALDEDPADPIPTVRVKGKAKPRSHSVRFE
jgi:hypothetical protein